MVDTENVGSSWKHLLEHKQANDRVLLFYTENSPHISYLDLEFICKYHDAFEMIRCNTGKNALDFQLVSYLGYLMKSAPKTRYIILSNDTGYDPMIHFWNAKSVKLSRLNSNDLESVEPVRKKMEVVKVENDKEKLVRSTISELKLNKDQIKKLETLLFKEDLGELRDVHNEITQLFGMELGSQVYRTIKPIIKKIQ